MRCTIHILFAIIALVCVSCASSDYSDVAAAHAEGLRQYQQSYMLTRQLIAQGDTAAATATLDSMYETGSHVCDSSHFESMQAHIELQHWRMVVGSVVSLAVIVGLVLVGARVYRRLRLRQRSVTDLNARLISKLAAAEQRNTDMTNQINSIFDDLERRKAIERLAPAMLKEKGEEDFRNRFHLLYPDFEINLEQAGIKLGRREEVMCMLFVLGLDSQAVAETLGIARQSVNVARYRIRRKLDLPEEISLDEYLRALATGD